MLINTQKLLLLMTGLLFCLIGCDPEQDNLLGPQSLLSENGQTSFADTGDTLDIEASFQQDLQPILTARCAFAGCHVAGGPDGLDFSTYQTFIRGGEDGPVFSPGNAQSSDIIEEIVSGRMPPGGPRLSDAEIQLFVDWINQQNPQRGFVRHDDDDDHDDDHDDNDDDDDDDDDDHDDDHDDNDDDDDDDDDDD